MSKRTYARAGSVQNEVALKLAKVLRGTMRVHMLGGYAPGTSVFCDHPEQQRPVCLQDTLNDGGRLARGLGSKSVTTKGSRSERANAMRREPKGQWSVLPVDFYVAAAEGDADRAGYGLAECCGGPET